MGPIEHGLKARDEAQKAERVDAEVAQMDRSKHESAGRVSVAEAGEKYAAEQLRACQGPQAMTGAEVQKLQYEPVGLAGVPDGHLNSIEINLRFINGNNRRGLLCHHYCFYAHEVHMFRAQRGRLVKLARFTDVESVEEVG